ncbi:hypothetical protein A1140_03580 [Staphylococcus felis]
MDYCLECIFSIFSILFGVGFYIFMDRATYKGQNKYALYFRRLIVLFIFGVLHSFLQPGEALKFYAIAGVLLLIFLHLNILEMAELYLLKQRIMEKLLVQFGMI